MRRLAIVLVLLACKASAQSSRPRPQEPRAASAASDGSWTLDTLRSYLEAAIQAADKRYEQRFDAQATAVAAALAAQKEALAQALEAANKAVAKAETAAEKRFDAVNEFRGALKNQQDMLLPKAEAEQRFIAMDARVKAVEAATAAMISRGEGKSEITGPLWAIAGAVAAALIVYAITRSGKHRDASRWTDADH